MIEKILFPVGFSPSCAAMAPYVKRAAMMFGAQVSLIHVCDLASHNGFELLVRAPQEIAEEHEGIARKRLQSFLEAEFPPAASARILRSGEAAAEIAEVARTGGFDLIVMPTHCGPVPSHAPRIDHGKGVERRRLPGNDHRACRGKNPANAGT